MKLIELLVQELPKRGGWPKGESYAWQDHNREVRFSDTTINDFSPESCVLCVEYRGFGKGNPEKQSELSVTRDQYEAALAAAQQPVWNGEGLPPVGCECERSWVGDKWLNCRVLFIGEEIVVVKIPTREAAYRLSEVTFRPIRSEADKKRDEVIEGLAYYVGKEDAEDLYAAIAIGNIKGVKLSD